jgi:DNA-binding transcriptional LysR family regulator
MPHDRSSHRFKLRDLRLLTLVLETGSMGKAAQLLNTSQPAVSRAIAALERAFGVPLFERSRQGVQPTPYGRVLARRGSAVFDELDQATKDIAHLSDPTEGEVQIGTSDFAAAGLASVVIGRISQRYPRIVFRVLSADAAALEQMLIERKIELFAGRIYDGPTNENTHVEIMFNDPFVIVADSQHPLARRRRIQVKELKEQHWVLPPVDTPSGSFIMDVFRRAGLENPKITVSSYSILLRQCLVASGRFVTVLPESTLRVIGPRLQLKTLPVTLPAQQSCVAIGTLKARAISPIAEVFIECAREVARKMPTNWKRGPTHRDDSLNRSNSPRPTPRRE